MLLNQATALLNALAGERRRIVSDWRAMILLRRATAATPPSDRRWLAAPRSSEETRTLLRRLEQGGSLRRILGTPHLYEVTAPFAPTGALDSDELLLEVNPYAALSHQSALAFHTLTTQLSRNLTATVPRQALSAFVPIGTTVEDWLGVRRPPARRPGQILAHQVAWTQIAPRLFFGVAEYRPYGYPLRVTDVERTLIDALQQPDLCGGIDAVFHAWASARDVIDLDLIIDYVDRFQITLLRQRAGYVIEALELHHAALDRWAAAAARGGSSKLIASRPYSSSYSERWNLSINAPTTALRDAVA